MSIMSMTTLWRNGQELIRSLHSQVRSSLTNVRMGHIPR